MFLTLVIVYFVDYMNWELKTRIFLMCCKQFDSCNFVVKRF